MIKIIPTQVWLGAILLVGVLGYVGGCTRGQNKVQREWDSSIARGKEKIAELEKRANTVRTKVETKYVTVEKEILVKGETVTKYVNKYIPQGTGCSNDGMLDGAFRVLHDSAVTGEAPTATSISDAASVSVTDATTTITENYAGCKVNAAKVDALQTYIRDLCTIYGCQ